MEMFKMGKKSLACLASVKTELECIARLALYLSEVDFSITEGIRTLERQKLLVAEGKSTTINSRHLLGEAVDFAAYIDGRLNWDDIESYEKIGAAFKQAAKMLGYSITWGGDWINFKDYCHVQIEKE